MRASLTIAFLLVVGCERALPPGWVYVTAVTRTAATVVWTGRGNERVACRDTGGRALAAPQRPRARGLFIARLEGLQPATGYSCRITGDVARYPPLHFRTAPPGAERFVFAAVGDTGDGSREARTLARRIRAARPAFLIHLGDLAYRSSNAPTLDRRFFALYRYTLARVPLFPTPGNHDARGVYSHVFAPAGTAEDGALNYAFDWGAAHFASVAYTDFTKADKVGPRWLADDLARASARPWSIVFLHEPPFSPGAKRVVAGLRERLDPVIEAGHVDVLLAGHQHFYARSTPLCESVPDARVLQVISGGGGAALDPAVAHPNFPRVVSATHFLRVAVSPDRLDVWAIDLHGHVLDRFRRWRARPPACRPGGWPTPLEK